MTKKRLDQLLVDRGLCESRSLAQRLIMAGEVLVAGQRIDKAGQLIAEDSAITLKNQPRFVSRGGEKLAAALEHWPIDIKNHVCIDIGASTGGFTDCLLQHGAQQVYAVDVGHNQLAWSLRQDARVISMEKTHILHLDPAQLDPLPSIGVMDVSFISAKKVLLHALACITSDKTPRHLVVLIKPQFEYRDYCNNPNFDGVVRNAEELLHILTGVCQDLMTLLPSPWQLINIIRSPIDGPKGNREFLAWLSTQPAESAQDWSVLCQRLIQ